MNVINLCFSNSQLNPDEYKEYKKKEYPSEKPYLCECGSMIIKHNLKKHLRSKKHLYYKNNEPC